MKWTVACLFLILGAAGCAPSAHLTFPAHPVLEKDGMTWYDMDGDGKPDRVRAAAVCNERAGACSPSCVRREQKGRVWRRGGCEAGRLIPRPLRRCEGKHREDGPTPRTPDRARVRLIRPVQGEGAAVL